MLQRPRYHTEYVFFQWLKERNVSYNNAIDVLSLSEMQSGTSQFSGLKRKLKEINWD